MSESDETDLIVVLGMHRSGTSAITRGIRVLGADFGDNLQPAVAGINEKGFFEDNDIVALNERLLKTLSIEWHTLRYLDKNEFNDASLNELKEKARILLKEKLTGSGGLLCVKDPRFSILLPFWKEIFNKEKARVTYVLCLRNPLSVADSLSKRDGFDATYSLYLWFIYNISALENIANESSIVVEYDRLLDKKGAEFKRVLTRKWDEKAINKGELSAYIREFISNRLRHSKYSPDMLETSEYSNVNIGELYRLMYEASVGSVKFGDRDAVSKIRKLKKHLLENSTTFGLVMRMQWRNATLDIQIAEARRENERLLVENREQNTALTKLANRNKEFENVLAEHEGNLEALASRNLEFENALAEQRKENELLRQDIVGKQEELSAIAVANQALRNELSSSKKVFDAELAERMRQLSVLNDEIALLKLDSAALHQARIRFAELEKAISDLHASTSWRVTKPLRYAARLEKKLKSGTLSRLKKVLRGGASAGTAFEISEVAHRHDGKADLAEGSVVVYSGEAPFDPDHDPRLAVHVHAFYPELFDEILAHLDNIPTTFKLYVTTDSSEKAKKLRASIERWSRDVPDEVRIAVNRGRDIAPMLIELGPELAAHRLVLHIHTKRSPHNWRLRGWRRFLLECLVGDERYVADILAAFNNDERLGMLYPVPYRPVVPFLRIGGNRENMARLLQKAGNPTANAIDAIDPVNFPAGFMFWFRGEVLQSFLNLGLTIEDFDAEAGQDDATISHAIERLVPYFVDKAGFRYHPFLTSELLSESPGAAPVSKLVDLNREGAIGDLILFFDHNIGGGTNRYTSEFIKNNVSSKTNLLRVFTEGEDVFAEWVSSDDGLLFASRDYGEIFDAVGRLNIKKIVVNSLHLFEKPDEVIENIVGLKRRLDAKLELNVHDYYYICPSQHLLDADGKYCHVPEDLSICKACLRTNPSAHSTVRQSENIVAWRAMFTPLVEEADRIVIFDKSSAALLKRAFEIESSKFRTVPHKDDYFQCDGPVRMAGDLHIGVLGTLTTVKGADVLNALAGIVEKDGMDIPITLVGRTVVPVHGRIKVLGAYETDTLKAIIEREGINFILMPTVVPETFSYTISEAMQMKLPVLSFDIGAQGNRVQKYELGKVVPLDTATDILLDEINSLFDEVRNRKIWP